MPSIILITGGARSGKSRFAEQWALETANNVIYIATAVVTDKAMKQRIKRHKESRPPDWKTIEKYHNFETLPEDQDFWKADTLLLDCVTIMVTNLMLDSKLDFNNCTQEDLDILEVKIYQEIIKLLNIAREYKKQLIIVTNEVGMGIVPDNYLTSYFRDIAGRMNQLIARYADEVYLVVTGIPVKIKG